MKTIQVVLDERTLKAADRAAKKANVNRSALIRRALSEYFARQRERELEAQHRRGYERFPQDEAELAAWESVAEWPE